MAQNIFPQWMPAVELQEANDNTICWQAKDNPRAEISDEFDESVTVAAHQNQNEADEAGDWLAWVEDLASAELLLYWQEVPLCLWNATGAFNSPLEWWRKNEKFFPLLAEIAAQILAISTTSAPSERVLSAGAGLKIAKDWASLDPANANELVFLH